MQPSAGPLQKKVSSRPQPTTWYVFGPVTSTSIELTGHCQRSLVAQRTIADGRLEHPTHSAAVATATPQAAFISRSRDTWHIDLVRLNDRRVRCGHWHVSRRDRRNDHTNHHYDDPDKEVSHRRSVASGFVVQELERSVERKKLHHDTCCDDAGRDHTAPRPLSCMLEVPESNEGE